MATAEPFLLQLEKSTIAAITETLQAKLHQTSSLKFDTPRYEDNRQGTKTFTESSTEGRAVSDILKRDAALGPLIKEKTIAAMLVITYGDGPQPIHADDDSGKLDMLPRAAVPILLMVPMEHHFYLGLEKEEIKVTSPCAALMGLGCKHFGSVQRVNDSIKSEASSCARLHVIITDGVYKTQSSHVYFSHERDDDYERFRSCYMSGQYEVRTPTITSPEEIGRVFELNQRSMDATAAATDAINATDNAISEGVIDMALGSVGAASAVDEVNTDIDATSVSRSDGNIPVGDSARATEAANSTDLDAISAADASSVADDTTTPVGVAHTTDATDIGPGFANFYSKGSYRNFGVFTADAAARDAERKRRNFNAMRLYVRSHAQTRTQVVNDGGRDITRTRVVNDGGSDVTENLDVVDGNITQSNTQSITNDAAIARALHEEQLRTGHRELRGLRAHCTAPAGDTASARPRRSTMGMRTNDRATIFKNGGLDTLQARVTHAYRTGRLGNVNHAHVMNVDHAPVTNARRSRRSGEDMAHEDRTHEVARGDGREAVSVAGDMSKVGSDDDMSEVVDNEVEENDDDDSEVDDNEMSVAGITGGGAGSAADEDDVDGGGDKDDDGDAETTGAQPKHMSARKRKSRYSDVVVEMRKGGNLQQTFQTVVAAADFIIKQGLNRALRKHNSDGLSKPATIRKHLQSAAQGNFRARRGDANSSIAYGFEWSYVVIEDKALKQRRVKRLRRASAAVADGAVGHVDGMVDDTAVAATSDAVGAAAVIEVGVTPAVAAAAVAAPLVDKHEQALSRLKRCFEQNTITLEDYNKYKQEVLKRMTCL